MSAKKLHHDEIRKPFFVISTLEYDTKPIGKLKRYDDESEAIKQCEKVIEKRGRMDQAPITFCVLQVVSTVHFAPQPPLVRKLA